MNAIKKLRCINRLTQLQLAKEINVDRSTIAKWETGSSKPNVNKLPIIAKVLNCSINDLFEAS